MAAELAIVGAVVRTLDPSRPAATAVAVRDGVLVAVGDDDAVRAACDARTRVIDAGGRALVPGLVDAHAHPFWGAELTRGVALTSCGSAEEVRGALAAERERVGDGWVFGWGLDADVLPGGVLDVEHLMQAVGDVPAVVHCADLHTVVASQRALALAGIDGPRSFDDASEVVCVDGRPTGELREASAFAPVLEAAPAQTHAELRARGVAILRRQHTLGLTGVHVMDGEPSTFDDLRELEARDELTMRLVVPFWQTPSMSDEERAEHLLLRAQRGRLWRGGVAKFFLDGVVGTGTAWLEEPDTAGDGTAPFWPDPSRYVAAVRDFARAGFQVATHAIGDRAVRQVLDAYAEAGAAPGVRHRIEHLETLPDALVARIAAEGVVASMQPVHLWGIQVDGTDSWSERLGPERAGRAYRMRSLLDAGATLALGSDWPVADDDPRLGMAVARLRRPPGTDEGGAVVPAERLTALEALAGYTTGAAAAVGESAVAGRIAVGMRADLTGFAEDPVLVDADDLPDLPVWLTVVDGRVVHEQDT